MKLQGWIIIFAIIIIPIILVMSTYIQLQISYVNTASSYDTYLNNATYDAIKAFQINELNSNTQNIAQEKIRDVEASINTFYNSLASNFGQSGYSQDELESYVPALVYTLYDGYYIYTKYNNVVQDDGTIEGTINLNSTDSTYGVKPYVYYSARYKDSGTNKEAVINYTLDNYITVYYTPDGGNTYKTYSGYLIDLTKANSTNHTYNSVSIPTEGIAEANQTTYEMDPNNYQEMNYAYITNDQGRREKAYWDDKTDPANPRWFKYNVDGTRNYQDENMLAQLGTTYKEDNSAQKYIEDAVKFTKDMKAILGWIQIGEIVDVDNKLDLGIADTNENEDLIDFSNSGKMLDTFNEHKLYVMRNSINTNLKATIAKINENSNHPAKMPTLTEYEWTKILNNTCLISFMEGQMIGSGYYMGYSIVTNNLNREFVDPSLIYVLDKTERVCHDIRHFDGLNTSNELQGFRNVDFEAKNYIATDGTNQKYYQHKNVMLDYACLVDSAKIVTSTNSQTEESADGNYSVDIEELVEAHGSTEVKRIYYTALFRERYNSYKSNVFEL